MACGDRRYTDVMENPPRTVRHGIGTHRHIFMKRENRIRKRDNQMPRQAGN
jgi:hypothetical protein